MNAIARFFSKFTIPLILLLSLWMVANISWSGERWKYIITSDGKGYYAYLPAVFIYNDPNFGFFDSIEAKYYDSHTKYDFRAGAYGKTIDKYFCGMAVLQTPFFLTAHLLTKLSGGTADGYSKLYAIFVNLGALFYLGIGLLYFRRFLRLHGASGAQAAFIIAAIYFGTNLLYYSLIEPAMSHVYSFAMMSMFLVYGKKWIENGNKKQALFTALLLGMIVLIRPVNGLIAFWLIFEAGGFAPFLKCKLKLLRSLKTIVGAILLFLFPLSLQFIFYKIATGHFFVDAYGEERFYFLRPEIFNFLFSYKKGLFVYLPLTLVSLGGLIFLWKKDRFRALFAGCFLFAVIYILSCWWMWFYGGSFGTRVIVEFLPVFGLLLFFLLNGVKSKAIKMTTVTLIILLVTFCQLQTYQYRYEIIHWSEMTKEKYWEAFLRMGK